MRQGQAADRHDSDTCRRAQARACKSRPHPLPTLQPAESKLRIGRRPDGSDRSPSAISPSDRGRIGARLWWRRGELNGLVTTLDRPNAAASSSLWTLQQLVEPRQNPRQRFREVLGYESQPRGQRGFGVQPHGCRSRPETTHALCEKAGGKAGKNVARARSCQPRRPILTDTRSAVRSGDHGVGSLEQAHGIGFRRCCTRSRKL